MELDYDQQIQEIESVKKEIAYWREVLKKSEKYERLMEDPDFKDVLKDLADTAKAHDDAIGEALATFNELSLDKLREAQHIVFIHQMKREYVEAAIARPKQILELAKSARKNIPDLEERLKHLKEITHG